MSKMVKCKMCGQPIAKSAKVCPHCGAKANRHPILIAVSVVLLVIFVFLSVGIIVASQSSSDDENIHLVTDNQENDESQNNEQVIYDDDGLVISFTGFADAPSPAIGYYINLHIENHSDTDYTIQAEDVSVDGIMVPFSNCIFSADVLAGKVANTYMWITNTEQLGITQTPASAEFTFRFFLGKDMSTWNDSDVISIK